MKKLNAESLKLAGLGRWRDYLFCPFYKYSNKTIDMGIVWFKQMLVLFNIELDRVVYN